MFCPKCGKKYKNERICPTCHRVLVDERPDPGDAEVAGLPPPVVPDVGSDHDGFEREGGVSGAERVFQTKDTGLLPLATMALDSAGIHYVVHGGGSDMFGIASGIELHVRPADATEARRLLADLEHAGERGLAAGDWTAASEDPSVSGPAGKPESPTIERGTASIHLIDAESGWPVSAVTVDQLEWLAQRLERDLGNYYLDAATLGMLEGEGADAGLLDALRKALGDRDGVDLRPGSELLFDAETGGRVGVVSPEQFQQLLAHGAVAEVELTDGLLAGLEEEGADAGLVEVLRKAADGGAMHVTAVKPARPQSRANLPLLDTQSESAVGALTEYQAAWLAERLEFEKAVFEKPDYCIDGDVIDYLKEEGAEPDLLEMLRKALGGRDEMFVRW